MPRGVPTAKSAALLFILAWAASSQTPTGAIAGVVLDASGAAVPSATAKAVDVATGLVRMTPVSPRGDYSFSAFLPGEYEVSVEAPGFQRMVRSAIVQAGTTTTVDFTLHVGDTREYVTVDGATPQMHYDSHAIGGVVTHNQIQDLPLNGRNFLELAKIEPGVQPPTVTVDGRTLLPVLGAPGGTSGSTTRVTIDGASIMAPGYAGSKMAFSQEVVEEFQISTVNFDLSTGITLSGAVNVVTRSGGNDFHGTGFYFFRDHNLAAYPALNRDPANPDPFFQRRQFGGAAGGPIRRNRAFFFANWERNEQRGVSSTTQIGDFASLSGITPTPAFDTQLSIRLDTRLSDKHTVFVRYSHDGNRAFGPAATQNNAYPSNWFRTSAWADQSLLAVTSVFRPALVNDVRFSYFFVSSRTLPALQQDCAGCLGAGSPAINIPQAGLMLGQSQTVVGQGRRFELSDSVSVQHGSHRTHFGVDWEHDRGENLTWNNQPVTITLFSPAEVRAANARSETPAILPLPLPTAFNTLDDILSLPLKSFTLGIGDPRVPEENGDTTRTSYTARVYVQDAWRPLQGLTLNYGLAWNVDRNQNYDLSKPPLLAPILGADGLGPTRKQWRNFSPSLGFAWSPSRDEKTVIRAGAGIYYDFLTQPNLDPERAELGPPGLGRQNIAGSAIANPLSTIPGVPAGTPLDFSRGSPTLFTGFNLIAILPSISSAQQQRLAYTGDPSVRAIQITKQASNPIYPVHSPTPSTQQADIGVQRQVTRDFVVSADFAYRHFTHLGWSLDLNHFNSGSPVIPKCVTATQQNDPHALCSTGPINVFEAAGTATYKGLLFRADKRFSHGFQLLGSYAYSSNIGNSNSNGFNLTNWLQNRGPLPTAFTHILNVAGVAHLRWGLELGLNFSFTSAPPFNAYVGGIDFNGDGTTDDLLPGTTLGQFNRGLGKSDLVSLVNQFNQTYGGTAVHGRVVPRLTLPNNYAFGDNLQSLDLRVSRSFLYRERFRLSVIGEVFNLYNAANLTGYSGDLTSAAFGQPTSRATQIFGSGGPRAFQVAMRMGF